MLITLAFWPAVPVLAASAALAHTDAGFAAVSAGPDDSSDGKRAQERGRSASSSTSVSVRVLPATPTPTPTPTSPGYSGAGDSNSVNVQSGGSDSAESSNSGPGGSCSSNSGPGGPCSVDSGPGEAPALPFTGVDGRELTIRVLTGLGAVLFGTALVWLSFRRRRFQGRV
ncbi:hypothetical protein [Streptosporangium lutulentum]|uniref:Gram-positive cocci surface proteins LPxTG domain-containing protein n=1 Tax=Streptosporangium lutulentum TaxID=1461250 RepID=A0ABT9QNR5_9ACTN|nr:hypothetical protein [Streptosporangium lutulentum]MDP9848417.1 hypothetical protein [Streptosporangium lutulentum]